MSAMMATALTMVWVLVMSGSAVAQSTLNYPLRMSDQAPVLVWTPTPQISDTDKGYPAKAWNVTYNESSWASWTEGNSGKGKSAHTTSFVGASVTVSFIGTGVSFYGSIDDGHVEVSADGGGIYPFYDNISPLALVNGLEYGVHSVTLYTRGTPTTLVSISGVEVTTWIESPAYVLHCRAL
jgi:hypothetical protein